MAIFKKQDKNPKAKTTKPAKVSPAKAKAQKSARDLKVKAYQAKAKAAKSKAESSKQRDENTVMPLAGAQLVYRGMRAADRLGGASGKEIMERD